MTQKLLLVSCIVILSIDDDGCILFTNMKLQNEDDMRTMLSIFGQDSTKGQLDATFVISVYVFKLNMLEILRCVWLNQMN